VPENIDIKAQTYRAIDPLIGPKVIVASDTSGIRSPSCRRISRIRANGGHALVEPAAHHPDDRGDRR